MIDKITQLFRVLLSKVDSEWPGLRVTAGITSPSITFSKACWFGAVKEGRERETLPDGKLISY